MLFSSSNFPNKPYIHLPTISSIILPLIILFKLVFFLFSFLFIFCLFSHTSHLLCCLIAVVFVSLGYLFWLLNLLVDLWSLLVDLLALWILLLFASFFVFVMLSRNCWLLGNGSGWVGSLVGFLWNLILLLFDFDLWFIFQLCMFLPIFLKILPFVCSFLFG